MHILFIEPPKDIWFVMGEYLPPPFGILQLAAFLDREVEGLETRARPLRRRIYWYMVKQGILHQLKSLIP
jgi:hypothetical protein